MRHGIKKNKFRGGRDATRMLVRSLTKNFFLRGKIETTLKKAKVLKSQVEHIVALAGSNTPSVKNKLFAMLADKKTIKNLIDNIGPELKDKVGGYVRVIKSLRRDSDGAEMARVEWVYPVVLETAVEPKNELDLKTDKTVKKPAALKEIKKR